MKKVLFFVISVAVLIGCNSDKTSGGLKVSGSIVNSSEYDFSAVKEVRANLWDREAMDFWVAGKGTWKSGSFTVNLSGNVPAGCLSLLANEASATMIISDNAAKVASFGYFNLTGVNNIRLGTVSCSFGTYTINTTDAVRVAWYFVDRQVKVMGTNNNSTELDQIYNYSYNLNLSRGWNTVYIIEHSENTGANVVSNIQYTTTKPNTILLWAADR